MRRKLLTIGCATLTAWCAVAVLADEVAAPWGTIHGNIGGTASSSDASLTFDSATWSFGAEVAWTLDLEAVGLTRTPFWSSIVFDEVGNLYWKGHATTSSAGDARIVSVAPDGTIRWTGNDGIGGDHFLGSTSSDTVVVGDGGPGGYVYALGDDGAEGFAVAYSKADGSVQWLSTLPGSRFSGSDVGVRRLTPVLYGGKLFVLGAYQFDPFNQWVRFFQVDTATGILDWSADIPAVTSGVTVNYRGQMTLVPEAFGSGVHGLFFNGSSGSGSDSKNEMYAIEVNPGANTASVAWSSEGGHVTRSHVLHLAGIGRVCTHTWTDFGAEFYCWDLDGANPVAYNNITNSGHGFYDVGCADFDGDDVIAGGFDGRVVRYRDIDVSTNGPAEDVYYQMEEWWGELRALAGLYQDADGNSILISATNSRSECENHPPESLGGCLGETGYEARVFAVDVTNGLELPNCEVVDDGPIYIDNFTITGGFDEGSQSTILSVAGFESYAIGDVPTDGSNPGGSAPAGFTWDSSHWSSPNGPAQIIADPTGTTTKVMQLDAFQGCLDYQGIFADLGAEFGGEDTDDWVMFVSWDQYREDTWDNVYMAEHPDSDGWWAIQWDVPSAITPRRWLLQDDLENPAPVLTAGQWEHVEYKIDFLNSEVTVTVNGTESLTDFLDFFGDPRPERDIRGWLWNMEGGEWTGNPDTAVLTTPLFAHNTGSVYDHAFTVRGGPLLGPTVGAEAEQHIYYFKPQNLERDPPVTSRHLVALRGLGELIDCNSNGIPDSQDIAECDGSVWCSDCNGNNVPDGCDLDDGTLHDETQPGGGGPDGYPDECQDVTGPQVEAARSFKVHGTALGDSLTIEMDEQINLDPGSDPDYDAIYAGGGGFISFEDDGGDGFTRMHLEGVGWYYGPYVDLGLAGYDPISVAGGGTLEFDARYYQDPVTNDDPYADAPIFVRLYTDDEEGEYLGHRDYGMVYQTGIGWMCDPVATYPSWVHISIDLGDLLADPNCDGTPDVAEGGDFDPTRVTRFRVYGTDWFGHGDDYVDIKNLEINSGAYPNRLAIDVHPNQGVECRQTGATEVLVTFDEDVFGIGGLSLDDVTVSSGSVTAVSSEENKLTIELTGTTNGDMLTIAFPGIEDELANVSSDTLVFGVLLGDSQGDMDVDVFDWALFQTCFTGDSGGPIDADCARADFIADGDVTSGDHAALVGGLTGPLP